MDAQMIQLGGSLIPILFIGMGMVDIGKIIPKLRLRQPLIPLPYATEPIEPRTLFYEIRFFLLLCPPCHAIILVVSKGELDVASERDC